MAGQPHGSVLSSCSPCLPFTGSYSLFNNSIPPLRQNSAGGAEFQSPALWILEGIQPAERWSLEVEEDLIESDII